MAKKNRQVILLLVIVVGGLLLILSQHALMRGKDREAAFSKERDLYLPEPDYLKLISLGHNGLISDLVLARAMTYFGSHYRERGSFGFKHLEKLFVTAIEMDPRNKEAVLIAGNILGDIDVGAAIGVLKRGMRHHPDYWKFPEMIGYQYFFKLNDPGKAAQYYEMAARMPGHPPYVPSLSGKFYRESGRYEEAIRVLNNFYSTTRDPRLKKSFKDAIDSLRQQVKNRDFYLNATILKVVDSVTVEFQPDLKNPQYQFLKPVETLRIAGLEPIGTGSGDIRLKLRGLFQLDFARSLLGEPGTRVRIEFERTPGGGLKQDASGRFFGAITLKNDRPYLTLMDQSGIAADIDHMAEGEPIHFDSKKIYRYTGKVIRLRFPVHRVDIEGERIYLRAASRYRNTFSVVIPGQYKRYFTGGVDFFKGYEGKTLTIKGLALARNRQVEMNLYFPLQLD